MGLTLNAIKANAAHPARQVQVGEIADSRYDAGTLLNPPSLAALKLQDLLMKAAGGSVVEDRWHTLPISTIKTQVGMKNATRAEIIGWLRELRGAVLEYQNLKDGYTGIYGLLGAGRVEFDESRGVMKFRFDDEFRKVADESNLYAVLDRQTALQLSSRYAHRLHEIIALKAGRAKSSQEFDLEDIRARLGVPAGKLSAWIDFRRKALEAAIDEVNKLSRFKVGYRITGKKGRKVAKVTLEWEVLADLEPIAKELRGSKVGRRARLTGTAETVAAAFPADGNVKGSGDERWLKIAQKCARTVNGGRAPDYNLIGKAFVAFSAARSAPLDDAGVVQRWRTFCGTHRLPGADPASTKAAGPLPASSAASPAPSAALLWWCKLTPEKTTEWLSRVGNLATNYSDKLEAAYRMHLEQDGTNSAPPAP